MSNTLMGLNYKFDSNNNASGMYANPAKNVASASARSEMSSLNIYSSCHSTNLLTSLFLHAFWSRLYMMPSICQLYPLQKQHVVQINVPHEKAIRQ